MINVPSFEEHMDPSTDPTDHSPPCTSSDGESVQSEDDEEMSLLSSESNQFEFSPTPRVSRSNQPSPGKVLFSVLLSFSFRALMWLTDWIWICLQSKHYILSLGFSFCNVIHDWLRCQLWPHHCPLFIFSFLFLSGAPGNGTKGTSQFKTETAEEAKGHSISTKRNGRAKWVSQ